MNTAHKEKTVLVISFSQLDLDPRVNRQIRCLTEEYQVIAAGYAPSKIEKVQYIPLDSSKSSFQHKIIAGFRLLGGLFESQYWRHPRIVSAWERLKDVKADVVIANDIDALPLGLKLAGRNGTVFDAHEYAPKEFEDILGWNLFYKRYKTYLCKKYIPKANSMMTVSQGIANEYQRQFRVLPHVVTNAPDYNTLSPSPMNGDKIRMVCHSYAMPSRKLELLIDLFEHLDDRFELDLILMPYSDAYLHKLKQSAKKYSNIRFPDTVPMREIPGYLNQYDIGVYILPPLSFNNAYALPNKLFEFIQARLAVAIGPSPEMSSIISKYRCGIISMDYSSKSLADALNAQNRESVQQFKINADVAAKELCAEKNMQIVQFLVKQAAIRP